MTATATLPAPLLTIPAFAKLAGISRVTAHRWHAEGRFAGCVQLRSGNRTYLSRAKLIAAGWLTEEAGK